MNWLKRIFNCKKAPRAINEMKPVDIRRYEEPLKIFVFTYYLKVKYSWKRSPKHYFICISKDGDLKLVKQGSNTNKMRTLVGNLHTLYHQYYGKENKK